MLYTKLVMGDWRNQPTDQPTFLSALISHVVTVMNHISEVPSNMCTHKLKNTSMLMLLSSKTTCRNATPKTTRFPLTPKNGILGT
uniref:Uncharacterized protein n=1 Tax=Octopus bimaculoides TaxID=37653 RepID=A0A0L8GN60_OCTBM